MFLPEVYRSFVSGTCGCDMYVTVGIQGGGNVTRCRQNSMVRTPVCGTEDLIDVNQDERSARGKYCTRSPPYVPICGVQSACRRRQGGSCKAYVIIIADLYMPKGEIINPFPAFRDPQMGGITIRLELTSSISLADHAGLTAPLDLCICFAPLCIDGFD